MIINASNEKYPDPLFPLADKKFEEARAHILSARDALKNRTQWNAAGNPVDVARTHLSQSLRLTNLLLATTF
jgi:hypothetical protein